ncbi:methyltransferase family protein [Mycolicibacterium goodii]|uniref:methyltransferase family protein n=1 Tax=Mycolicibacterium goodii TaxID=134601 RepID=UPI000A527C21
MTGQRRLWWRHLLSVLLAPAMMTVFIPTAIAASTDVTAPDLSSAGGLVAALAGAVLIGIGLGFLVWTVVLFDRVGEGTLAIGSPVHLVLRGPYRHVRNPMMTAVFCIQLGTAVATLSPWLFGLVRAVLHRHGDRHPAHRGTAPSQAVRQ